MPKRTRTTLRERDLSKHQVSHETKIGRQIIPQANGCWLWKGQSQRYGASTVGPSQHKAKVHRYVYGLLVGPIDDELILHHHCETPGCCNPAHLEPMTQGDHRRLHAALKRSA